jgi:hypothetical protein
VSGCNQRRSDRTWQTPYPRWPHSARNSCVARGDLPPPLVSQTWAPYPPANPTGIAVFGGARLAEGFTGGDDLTMPCNALFHLELAATGESGGPIWSKLHSSGSGLRQPASRQGAGLVGLEGGLWLWGGRCANHANDPRVWWFDGTTWSVLCQEEAKGSKSKMQGPQRGRECFVSANIGDEVLVWGGVQGRNKMVVDAALWSLNMHKRKWQILHNDRGMRPEPTELAAAFVLRDKPLFTAARIMKMCLRATFGHGGTVKVAGSSSRRAGSIRTLFQRRWG